MGETKEEGVPTKITRRNFLRKVGIAAGGILVGAELASCKKRKAPEFGSPVDDLYYTIKVEHGKEEYAHIREKPHMGGEIIGEIPTQKGLVVENIRKVWGSETGAAHGITTFPDGSRGWWFKGIWTTPDGQKIEGFISSQFVTIEKSYDKPIE